MVFTFQILKASLSNWWRWFSEIYVFITFAPQCQQSTASRSTLETQNVFCYRFFPLFVLFFINEIVTRPYLVCVVCLLSCRNMPPKIHLSVAMNYRQMRNVAVTDAPPRLNFHPFARRASRVNCEYCALRDSHNSIGNLISLSVAFFSAAKICVFFVFVSWFARICMWCDVLCVEIFGFFSCIYHFWEPHAYGVCCLV